MCSVYISQRAFTIHYSTVALFSCSFSCANWLLQCREGTGFHFLRDTRLCFLHPAKRKSLLVLQIIAFFLCPRTIPKSRLRSLWVDDGFTNGNYVIHSHLKNSSLDIFRLPFFVLFASAFSILRALKSRWQESALCEMKSWFQRNTATAQKKAIHNEWYGS